MKRTLMGVLFLCMTSCTGCGNNERQLLQELTGADATARRAAIRELSKIPSPSPEVQDAISKALSDDDRDVRRLACIALGDFRSNHADSLHTVLDDKETSVRIAAAYALLKLDPSSEPAARILCAQMEEGDGGVIVAVSRQFPDANWAIPTLTKLLRDHRPGIRRLAAEGLGRLADPTDTEAVKALRSAENDKDDRVRSAATAALEQITKS